MGLDTRLAAYGQLRRRSLTRYGVPIILIGMITAGLRKLREPDCRTVILIPLGVISMLALLARIVLESARGSR